MVSSKNCPPPPINESSKLASARALYLKFEFCCILIGRKFDQLCNVKLGVAKEEGSLKGSTEEKEKSFFFGSVSYRLLLHMFG